MCYVKVKIRYFSITSQLTFSFSCKMNGTCVSVSSVNTVVGYYYQNTVRANVVEYLQISPHTCVCTYAHTYYVSINYVHYTYVGQM